MTGADQTVYVVDDDEPVRDSLRLLLQSMGLKTATFDSAQSFLDNLGKDAAGCLLLDIRMPGMSGVELFDQMQALQIKLPVIFITGHGDVPMAVRAIKKGAFDFLQKPFNDQELLDRVNSAMRQDARRVNEQDDRRGLLARWQRLTPREREIMQRVVSGQANKVIAIDLHLSERTVELHRSHVMEKMQVRSLAELVALGVKLREQIDDWLP